MMENIIPFILYVIKLSIFVYIIIFITMFIWYYYLEDTINEYIRKIKNISKSKLLVYSIIFGILSVGSSIIWLSILSKLKEKGIESKYIATFLFARAIKPLLIPLQIYLLGLKITLIMNTYLLLISPIAGILTERLEKYFNYLENRKINN